MNILNDTEHRIFLSAMSREEKICKETDALPGVTKLLPVCKSIQRKVNEAIPKSVYDQVRTERDIAIAQLAELGYEFGSK